MSTVKIFAAAAAAAALITGMLSATAMAQDAGTVIAVKPSNQVNGCLRVVLLRDDNSTVVYSRFNSDPGIVGWAAAITSASQPGWRLQIGKPGSQLPCGGTSASDVAAVSPAGATVSIPE